MDKSLYSRRSNLVIGFHGCDKTVVDAVVAGKTDLLSSTNDYDWLETASIFGKIMRNELGNGLKI